METRTRFVFLMHPKEFKQEKAATGRLTHLCLANSEIHMGVGFDDHPEVQERIHDPHYFPVLLYPGSEALNLSGGDSLRAAGENEGRRETDNVPRASALAFANFKTELRQRRLLVVLLDATWSLGRKMLRLSPSLQRMPRIMFTPAVPSRFVIKQQPHAGCLSTLEATHELLLTLERAGLDHYPLPQQLLGLFHRMQDFQMRCAADPARSGYRRRPYSAPGERVPPHGRSGSRRSRIF